MWETSTTQMFVTPSTYPSRSTGSSLCGIPQAPGSSATASVRVRSQPGFTISTSKEYDDFSSEQFEVCAGVIHIISAFWLIVISQLGIFDPVKESHVAQLRSTFTVTPNAKHKHLPPNISVKKGVKFIGTTIHPTARITRNLITWPQILVSVHISISISLALLTHTSGLKP